jgi:hypothetical protein
LPLETVIEKPSLESVEKPPDDIPKKVNTTPEETKTNPMAVVEQQNTDRT